MQFPEPTLTQEFLAGFLEIWRLWVPLLLLLIWVGWATRRWWGGRLLLLSLVVLIVFAAKVTLRERTRERATMDAWNKLRVPLHQMARIDGLQLAAGTMVRWNKEREGHLLTAELGTGQEVSPGMVGEVDHLWDEVWRGTLARESVLRGWTCAAGKVDIHNSGKLRWCVLAGRRRLRRESFPQGQQYCSILVIPVMRCSTCRMLGCELTRGSSGLHPTNGLSRIRMANFCRFRVRSLGAGSRSWTLVWCCVMATKTSPVGMATLRHLRRLHAHPGQ
jgi:hypothetical protein